MEKSQHDAEIAQFRQELYDRAAFGKQIEQFWSSAVGNYLQSRATECYTAAIQGLKSVDPQDWKAVQHLQNEISKAEQFKQWLSDGVADGLKALDIIQGNDDELA